MILPNVEEYAINHAFDLSPLKSDSKFSYLPSVCFQDVNPVSLAILGSNLSLLQKVLEKGSDANGITEKGTPFFSPLLLNAILNISDWEKEKLIIITLMKYPIDPNFLPLIGLNLFHFYLLETILYPQYSYKLEWWTKFPMVDVNAPLLLYAGKFNRSIHVYHPVEWLTKLFQRQGKDESWKQNILCLLFARGCSCLYGGSDFLPINPLDWENKFLQERLFHQWDVQSDHQLRFRIQNRDSFDPSIHETIQKILFEESGISPTYTLNLNPLETVPINHCLDFKSPSGKLFSFHASFLESMFKKHSYPFTGEDISKETIEQYLEETQKKWFPREEFQLSQIIQDFPQSLNQERILPQNRFVFALQKLADWISVFYPYTRVFQLEKRDENIFRFLFKEMNKGDFFFPAFAKIYPNITWKEQFFWACHDSLSNTFIFSNRLEELIGLLEINDLFDTPFHQKFPFARFFIEADISEHPLIKLYQEEQELSFLQLYYSLKHLSFELERKDT